MKPLLALAFVGVTFSQSACMAVAEVAYDDAVQRERAQCERAVAMSERQACLQRVDAAARQAAERRRKT